MSQGFFANSIWSSNSEVWEVHDFLWVEVWCELLGRKDLAWERRDLQGALEKNIPLPGALLEEGILLLRGPKTLHASVKGLSLSMDKDTSKGNVTFAAFCCAAP